MKKNNGLTALLFLGFWCGGCAGVMTKPFPYPTSNLNIGITDKRSDNYDWAPGSYHLPNANLCIARGQGAGDAEDAQALFGILGRAVAVGDLAGGIKKQLQGQEADLSFDLTAVTRQCLGEELAPSKGASRFSLDQNWKEAPLQITPYAVLSFVDETKARLWMVLRVEWVDANVNQNNNWCCRYIVGLGEPRPLTGENGWAYNHGKILENSLLSDTRLAVQVMLDDLNGKLRTAAAPKESIVGSWMFYKNPHMAKVRILKSTNDWDIALPLVDDIEYFAGVNVLPKNFALLQSLPEN